MCFVKYRNHASVNLIRKNLSLVNLFTFSVLTGASIERQLLKLNLKEAGTFENISTKV